MSEIDCLALPTEWTPRCQARYDATPCDRPAVWRYHGHSCAPTLLCDEHADRLCDTPDMPHVGRGMRRGMVRLEGDDGQG